MFRSKSRPLITPQSEHARLAGSIAQAWGNDRFELPELERASFIAGVTLHDRGFGYFDTIPIPDSPEDAWLETHRRGMTAAADPQTDLVVLFHIRRLLTYRSTPKRELLLKEVDHEIERRLRAAGYQRHVFEWADRITHLCDNAAFDFCFEEPRTTTTQVFARRSDESPLEIVSTISTDGTITLRPWPLAKERYTGFILCYRSDGYPETLQTVVREYTIVPG